LTRAGKIMSGPAAFLTFIFFKICSVSSVSGNGILKGGMFVVSKC
jgi:hypothetical protein